MSKSVVISCRVDEEMLTTLDRLAASYERSRAWVVHKLLTEAARTDLKELEFIEAGIADADAGRTISHEELIRQLEEEFEYKLGSKAA